MIHIYSTVYIYIYIYISLQAQVITQVITVEMMQKKLRLRRQKLVLKIHRSLQIDIGDL